MRRLLSTLIAMALLSTAAAAGVEVKSKVETYRISGDSGMALVQAMDRHGPRHGFMTRAIAQTRYSVGWELGFKNTGGKCRLETADVTLSVNYRYPELARAASPALQAKWRRFLVGVRKHEETHGRLARQMATEARNAVMRVAFADDPGCRRARREVTRVVQTTYAKYEARQQRFDAFEHQPGGNVDRLVSRLIRRDRT